MKDLLKEANQWADAKNIQVQTTDTSPYPAGKEDRETYGSYMSRIDVLRKNGFDLSRLSFSDYTDYCRGNYAPDSVEVDKQVQYHEQSDEIAEN